MASPPGKPWVEGDGTNVPYVLKWPPVTSSGARIVGYAVEVRAYGAGGDRSFKPLNANTGSKAARYGLSSFAMGVGAAYAFRVAAVTAGAAGKEMGAFSAASEPLECAQLHKAGASGAKENPLAVRPASVAVSRQLTRVGDDSSTTTVSDVKMEMHAWEMKFERQHGQRPTVSDKVSSKEYQALAKRHKHLRREEAVGGDGGGNGGGGGHGHSHGHRSSSRSGRSRERGGGKEENKEVVALKERERGLSKSLDKWEVSSGPSKHHRRCAAMALSPPTPNP